MFQVNPLPSRGFTLNIKSYFSLKNNEKIFMIVVCCSHDCALRVNKKSYLWRHGVNSIALKISQLMLNIFMHFLVTQKLSTFALSLLIL